MCIRDRVLRADDAYKIPLLIEHRYNISIIRNAGIYRIQKMYIVFYKSRYKMALQGFNTQATVISIQQIIFTNETQELFLCYYCLLYTSRCV